MKNHAFCAVFVFGAFYAAGVNAATSSLNSNSDIRPLSQYGLIQNVQDYSTNPFWTSSSSYNQKFPVAVYANGPELSTGDCQTTVGTLISTYCSANDNCIGKRISDIRPTIMLQLSRLPGHNYATSCAGFIDSEFDSYVATYSVAIPTGVVSFPGATAANPNYDAPEFKLENPYEIKDGTWNGEEWKKEKKERSKELENLQSQNGAGSEHLVKADFPTTFADLSFTEQTQVKQQGYEPFADKSAYKPISIEKEDDAIARRQRHSAFCSQTYGSTLADLDSDLQTVMACRAKGTPIAQCKTKGRY